MTDSQFETLRQELRALAVNTRFIARIGPALLASRSFFVP